MRCHEGYRGLLSAGWYLDKQIPGQTTHYEWVDTWMNFYGNEYALFLFAEANLVQAVQPWTDP